MPDIEEIRKKIDNLITEKGLNYRDASLKIGRKDSYLHQYVKYGYPRRLKEIDRVRLANLLGVDDSEIMDDDVIATKTVTESVVGYDNFVSVPVLSSKTMSGNVFENVIGQYMVSKSIVDDFDVENAKSIRVVKIYDDAMEPTISSGDSVWFDSSCKYPEADGLYILQVGNKWCVKRVQTSPIDGTVDIISDNAKYKPYQISDKSHLNVLGKILFVFHKL